MLLISHLWENPGDTHTRSVPSCGVIGFLVANCGVNRVPGSQLSVQKVGEVCRVKSRMVRGLEVHLSFGRIGSKLALFSDPLSGSIAVIIEG